MSEDPKFGANDQAAMALCFAILFVAVVWLLASHHDLKKRVDKIQDVGQLEVRAVK